MPPIRDTLAHPGWIQTYTGGAFWPLDPRPEDVRIVDIAHHLSNICRFTGATREFYSVAQHSVLVSMYVERLAPGDDVLALWGLLHDASEAYLCDVARPVKITPALVDYRIAEQAVMHAVCEHFKLPMFEPALVKDVDRRMLRTEQRDLMGDALPGDHRDDCPVFPERIVPMDPRQARQAFFNRYFALRDRLRP